MKKNISLICMLLIGSTMILNGCAGQPASPPKTGTVPQDLQAIEAAAEDIMDFVPSGDWDKVSGDVTDMRVAWEAYQPQAGQAGASQEQQDALDSALTQLEAAAASKDSAATMQASNDVSAAVVELFALYNPKIPPDIGRLDVLERQVILDTTAKDYSAATTSLARTMSVWKEVKPSVLEHKGQDVAAQFDASLDAQAVALDSRNDTALTGRARDALELVDALELLYR